MKRIYTDLFPCAPSGYLCPYCNCAMSPIQLHWQGAHTCVESSCPRCSGSFLCDLPSVQGAITPFILDKKTLRTFGALKVPWFSQILSDMVSAPSDEDINLRVNKHKDYREIVIINCLDFCYGHSLCSLLSVKEAIQSNPTKGIVLIINSNMQWLVPEGVAEEWVVDIPLSKMKMFFPSLSRKINEQIKKYDRAALFSGYTFDVPIDLSAFSRISPYDESKSPPGTVAFVWRDDNTRCWIPSSILRRFVAHFSAPIGAELQRRTVIDFFGKLRRHMPGIKCVVAGLGRHGAFPDWIIDERASKWGRAADVRCCEVLARSQLAVGVHGSHMILPSGHAGMTVSLMPHYRWGNIAEDLAIRSLHPRDTLLRYRILPIGVNASVLALIAQDMLTSYNYCYNKLVEHP